MDQAANLRRLVLDGETEPKKTKTIAIASGKGGVGKTSLAVNLSLALAKNKFKVTLLDADLGMANINVLLGVIPKYNLYHVIQGQKRLRDIFIEVPGGVKIIAGASGFYQLANLDAWQRDDFIGQISEIKTDDYVIIDTGAGVGHNVLNFVMAADEVLIITTPEPTAITDAYGIIKSIAVQSQEKVIRLIVNRVESSSEGDKVAGRIISIAHQFLNIKVENLGYIFDDMAVYKAVKNQKPFWLSHPKAKASNCISTIAGKIVSQDLKAQGGMGLGSFFKKLFVNE